MSIIPGTALDGLRLVQYHVVPLDTLKVLDVLDDQLVAGNQDVELTVYGVEEMLTPELTQDASLLRVPPVRQHLRKEKMIYNNKR